jgi:hypothetical protein
MEELDIDGGINETIEVSIEEYKKQLIAWWNSGENYALQHQGYT